jgi:hypothetical protein
MLSLIVLTSDDCFFKTTEILVDDNFSGNTAAAVSSMEAEAEAGTGCGAKVLLGYFPLMNRVGGDIMISVLDGATGGIPIFGTMAIDHNVDFSTAMRVRNGSAYRDRLVLGAIYGDVKFSFEIASLDETKIRKQKAIISESNGNLLISVNGEPVLDYLDSIGLTRDELDKGLVVVPLVIENKDYPRPVARAVIAFTDEGAVCGGLMPEGSTIAIGRIDMADVLQTTEKALGSFTGDGGTILSYSCMSRYLVLGADSNAEAEKVIKVAGGVPYIFACSGGEICPLPEENGALVNCFHNYTIVFCKLS